MGSITPKHKLLDPDVAWLRLAAEVGPLPVCRVERQQAVGRVLATDLEATVDLPQADVSAMDGYALCGESPADIGSTQADKSKIVLPVIGTIAAGRPPDFTLAPGQAAKIMTGAVMPRGGDRVLQVELTDGGHQRVTVHEWPRPGLHIRRLGEVVRCGGPLLSAGALLTPGAISLLASHGYGEIPVHGQPRVAVMSTGDEVVPPETEPGPGQLRDSNSSFLLAAGRSLGFDFHHLGIAPDDIDALRDLVRQGLEHDVLMLCGGVSMGDFDFVEDVLTEIGCELLFDRVAIQPGKPLVAARRKDADGKVRWVLGLPGNPASVMVTFWLFARPLLRRMMGLEDGYWQGAIEAELASPLPRSKARALFLAADVAATADGKLRVWPHAPQGSHDVVAYAHGTALVRIPPNSPPTPAGERCSILPLVDWPLPRG